MKITVIGCGRWGSFIAWYLDKIGHNVTVHGLPDAESFIQLRDTRTNGLITYPNSITLTTDISAVNDAETVIISIGSQGLRSLMTQIKELEPKNKNFVLCMKGIEIGTGCRLSEIASEYLDETNTVSVWIGPGHVQEFANGIPNCMVIDSKSEEAKNLLVKEFSSSVIRFYYGSDLIGNEIGVACISRL